MTPARRKVLERIKRGGEKKPRFGLKKLFIILLVFIGLLGFYKTQTRVWNASDKVAIAIFDNDRIVVSTFDPGAEEITNILIPGEVQVDSSRELGSFRIKNIWRLGENEKIGGVLLAETVTKNFKFPVTSWSDASGLVYSSGEPARILGTIFKPFKTNLGVGDKLALALFSLRVKNTNRVEVDLAQTGYLKTARLIDGEEGYLISGSPPQEAASIFADPQIASGSVRVVIINETGEASDPETVAQILEVIGGKVSSLVKGEIQDYDCRIIGREKVSIKKIARVFACDFQEEAPEGNFDLEVRLGKRFVERF